MAAAGLVRTSGVGSGDGTCGASDVVVGPGLAAAVGLGMGAVEVGVGSTAIFKTAVSLLPPRAMARPMPRTMSGITASVGPFHHQDRAQKRRQPSITWSITANPSCWPTRIRDCAPRRSGCQRGCADPGVDGCLSLLGSSARVCCAGLAPRIATLPSGAPCWAAAPLAPPEVPAPWGCALLAERWKHDP